MNSPAWLVCHNQTHVSDHCSLRAPDALNVQRKTLIADTPAVQQVYLHFGRMFCANAFRFRASAGGTESGRSLEFVG